MGREEEIKALQHFLEIVISSHYSQLVNVLGGGQKSRKNDFNRQSI